MNAPSYYGPSAGDDLPISGGKGYNMMMDLGDSSEHMRACPSCGRTFNPKPFEKHVKICKKVFVNKRKEFNTQQQRLVDGVQMRNMRQVNKEITMQKKKAAEAA